MPFKSKESWNVWNKKRFDKNQQALQKLRSAPCADCNELYPHYVMEFDHVPERGPKKANITTLVGSRSINAPSVQAELAKCDVVCANCHKVRTYKRQQQSGIV